MNILKKECKNGANYPKMVGVALFNSLNGRDSDRHVQPFWDIGFRDGEAREAMEIGEQDVIDR